MINDKEKAEIQKKDKDSCSEGSDHSLDGFDENVSDGEFADDTNQVEEEQVENNIIEEDVPERIEMRCGY